jgi:hypothetical protein
MLLVPLRLRMIAVVLVTALATAACGPSSNSVDSTNLTSVQVTVTSETATTSAGNTDGTPASEAVKAFYTTLFTGQDTTDMICTAEGVSPMAVQQTHLEAASSFTNATIDLSNLTFVSADSGEGQSRVHVEGSLRAVNAEGTTEVPISLDVPVADENGIWKVCQEAS